MNARLMGLVVAAIGLTSAQVQAQQTTVKPPPPMSTFTTPMPYGPYPEIDDVQPRSGPVGARITITGHDFRDVQSVTFGTVAAVFSAKSATKIIAFVPHAKVGTTFPELDVTTATGASGWEFPFTVFPQPPPHIPLAALPATAPPRSGLKPNPRFVGLIEKLRAKTRIPILLPSRISGKWSSEFPYGAIDWVDESSYTVIISGEKDCIAHACEYGTIAGELLFSDSPKHTGTPIKLSDGTRAYFNPSRCGANCSDSWIEWDVRGVRYSAGIKVGGFQEVLDLANSFQRY